MGRAGLVIKANELKAQILAVEATQTFENRSRLFDAICKTEWAKTIVDTLGRSKVPNAANIYQYVVKYKLEGVIKTPQGKRGNPGIHTAGTRKARADKIKSRPEFAKVKLELTKAVAWVNGGEPSKSGHYGKQLKEPRLKLVNKVLGGSQTAAIKAMCLTCCGNQASVAGDCKSYHCPLWMFNPFIKTGGVEVEEQDDTSEE